MGSQLQQAIKVSPRKRTQLHPERPGSNRSPKAAVHAKPIQKSTALTGTIPSSPWSQCFSRSYASVLPTSLGHIAPLTRGYSPRSPDAVIGTAEPVREATFVGLSCRRATQIGELQSVGIWISGRAFVRIVKAPRTAQKSALLSLCVQKPFST